MTSRTLRFAVLSLSVLSSLGGIQKAMAQQVVKIGVAGPLTGNTAAYGKDLENAVRLAVAEANAEKLTIGTQQITFAVDSQDDAGDPRIGVQVAQKLIDDHVAVVIGHYSSGTTIPATIIYSKAGIPSITASATNPVITARGLKTVFSVISNDTQNASAAAEYAVKVTKAKRIAIIDDRTAFGQGQADQFSAAVKAAGGNVIDREYTSDKDIDFSAQLTHIKGENADLLYFSGVNPQAALVVKRMKALGMRAQFLGGGGVEEPTFIEVGGKAAEGAMAWEYGEPLDKLNGGRKFEAAYKKQYGTDMLSYAPFAYDATWMAIRAMQAAKSVDPVAFIDTLRSQPYVGVTGKIAFTSSGALQSPVSTLYQVKNGKWVPIVTKSNF